VSGSSDNSAYIWNTTLQNSHLGGKPIASLQGHEAEVTCVEFSKEIAQPKLVTCSDDYKCKIWKTYPPNVLKLPFFDGSDGLQFSCGELLWNSDCGYPDAYSKGTPFPNKLRYDHSTVIYLENKSKRKLFSDGQENDENKCLNFQQTNLNKRCKTEGEYQKSTLRFAAYPSSSRMTNVLSSPVKASNLSNGVLQSPKKLNITPKKSKVINDIVGAANFLSSPTGNLPNIVLDGRSPHEKFVAMTIGSGKKNCKGKQKVDWLTEMGQQKKNSLPKKPMSKQQLTPICHNKKDENIYHVP